MNHPGWTLKEKLDTFSGKRIHTYRHNSGFRLDILPKPGYTQKFGSISIPYGSIHNSWRGDDGEVSLPAGTAHYLEHCAFTRDDGGGLLAKLSALGANANAYTSHSHTMYYFTAVDGFREALFTYFDALMAPVLSEERIEAERGIILSEINMYLDDPDSRAYNALLESLYHDHPVRLDIAGTAESVGSITVDMLKKITDRFYQPAVAGVTLVGDLDEDAILEAFDRRMTMPEGNPPILTIPDESTEVSRPVTDLKMDVGAPTFLFGVKDPDVLPSSPLAGQALIERRLSGRLVAETLAGPSSSLYNRLYEQGLLNESFGFQYVCERDFAYFLAGGESRMPRESVNALVRGLEEALDGDVDIPLFETQKKVAAGDFIRSMDQVRHCGMAAAHAALNHLDLFEYPVIYDRINPQNALRNMAFMKDPNQQTCVFVGPGAGEEDE